MVNYVVFRKSYDAISEIAIKSQYDALPANQKQIVDIASERLKQFRTNATEIAEISTAAAESILSAYPKSQTCFHNKPNDALIILSALIDSGAALVTGGEISHFGRLMSSLVTFSRELDYIKAISLPKKMEFFNKVSCLIESTQEAYCALQDGQEALDFLRSNNGKDPLRFSSKESRESQDSTTSADPMKSPVGGLVVLLRDIPTLTLWLQKILFGIDPKLEVEAEMKNSAWGSIVEFIKASNTLPAIYRDKLKYYYDTTAGKDLSTKQAQLQDMIAALTGIMSGGGMPGMRPTGGARNFFTSAINPELIPFFLIGIERFPDGYNPQLRNFETFWAEWSSKGTNGLGDPDTLIKLVEVQMKELIRRAGVITNEFFNSRLIVDPHNLMVEGMNGPAISPYRAMINIKAYSTNLMARLSDTVKNSKVASEDQKLAYRTAISLLKDTVLRLDEMIAAIRCVSDDGEAHLEIVRTDVSKHANDRCLPPPVTKDTTSQLGGASATASNGHTAMSKSFASNPELAAVLDITDERVRFAMERFYDVAKMLISRDSLIANRFNQAVRIDISQAIWENQHVTDWQTNLLKTLGKDVVMRLSNYFSDDPVIQGLDIAAAKPVHTANLQSVERLFARTMFEFIETINCQIYGVRWGACARKDAEFDPAGSDLDKLSWLHNPLRVFNLPKLFQPIYRDDSQSNMDLKAKLCIQSLAFESRGTFAWSCRNAVLQSYFSKDGRNSALNTSYNDELKEITRIQQSGEPGSFDRARTKGVCALRSFLRKNHVYRMYTDYAQGDNN
jgi:hypothetical protein